MNNVARFKLSLYIYIIIKTTNQMKNIIATAKNLGIEARKNGKSCVAAWDSKCVELAGTVAKHSLVFKAWVEGWNQENIKQAWN